MCLILHQLLCIKVHVMKIKSKDMCCKLDYKVYKIGDWIELTALK